MAEQVKSAVKVKVTIHKEESFFGPGIAQLMELLVQTGSMKKACREMGLSYTKGWFIMNRAEEQTGCKLLNRQHGGVDGGSSALTREGQKLLDTYEQLQERVSRYAAETYEELFPDGL